MRTHHRITIEIGTRRQHYRVVYANAVLIENSRCPEYDACRALLARGITGMLQVGWRGAAFPASAIEHRTGCSIHRQRHRQGRTSPGAVAAVRRARCAE